MTENEFRRLALSRPGSSEASHHGHPDFRAGGRIFATLGPPGFGTVLVSPLDQEVLVAAQPDAFEPCAGAWGERGATRVRLAAARPALVRAGIEAAWKRVAPAAAGGSVSASRRASRADRSRATRRAGRKRS